MSIDKDTRTGIDTLAFALADQIGPLRIAHMSAEYLILQHDVVDDTLDVLYGVSRQLLAAIKLAESAAESLLSWVACDGAELRAELGGEWALPVRSNPGEPAGGWPS